MPLFPYFSFNDKSSVLLIFFFNAVVFSILLFKKAYQEQRKDSNWLGFFILLCGLYICPFMLGYAGWYSIKSYREFMFFVPFQQVFLLGPVIYFYTRSLLNPDFRLRRVDYLHFAPAILYGIYSLIIFVTDKLVLDEFYFYADGRDKDLAFWYQMAGLISMLFYLILSLRHYQNYHKKIVQEVSYADEVIYKWLSHFMIAFSLLLVLRMAFFVVNPEWGEFGNKYWYYLCFSILFLYIAITGYSSTIKSSVILTSIPIDVSTIEIEELPEEKTREEPEMIEDLDLWKAKIETIVVKEQLYKNAQLTLSDLARLLESNRSLISQVINQGFQMNFNDYINSKRVDAVVLKIEKGAHEKHTLLALAIDAGFNSKSTFNRAFKKSKGMTPLQFIEKQK